ncbi:MAG: hypothetical protein ACRDRA_11630, partial [Pseudonocardiaceae bacterium]
MSVPAQPYGSFPAPSSPLRGGVGMVTFVLGLVAAFSVVVYAVWLVVTAVATVGTAADHVSGSVVDSVQRDDTGQTALAPPGAAPLAPPTPSDAT